jgi:hypothetical protein
LCNEDGTGPCLKPDQLKILKIQRPCLQTRPKVPSKTPKVPSKTRKKTKLKPGPKAPFEIKNTG